MNIGQLAKQAGVGVDTIRYYERLGVLPLPARQMSGYRRYLNEDLARLQFIRRAKNLGFTLVEITELLSLSRMRQDDMSVVNQATQVKLKDIQAKIDELQRMQQDLMTLLNCCPGKGTIEHCPILAAITNEHA